MTDICAAIGRVQLERLDDFVAARRAHARQFDDAVDGDTIRTPTESAHCRHAYHQYTVRCADRASLAAHLEAHGVDWAVYYSTPIHQQPAYDGFDPHCPVAEQAATAVLSIPVHPELSTREVRTVSLALTEFST